MTTKSTKHLIRDIRFNGAGDDSLMEVWCACGEGPFGPGDGEVPGSWSAHKAGMRHETREHPNTWQALSKVRHARKVEAA